MGDTPKSDPDLELIKLIAKAQSWWEDIKAGVIASQKELALRENLNKGDVSRILKLAFLAPDIVRAILKGQQPVDLTAHSLLRQASQLPSNWVHQKTFLGFA